MTLRRVLSIYCVAVLFLGVAARAQHAYRQLREFGFREQAASEPLSGVVVGPQGWVYGTSRGGHGGLIYRVKNDGTGFSIVYEFESTIFPSNGRLIVGSDGKLYGTAILGNGLDGAVYRIQSDGTGFQVYALPSEARTISGVIEGSDGRLYGTTLGGGVNEAGTVFGINKDGSGFATLHGFNVSDGYQPGAEPLEGSDGRLYLTTRGGGSGNAGVVCALNKNGTGFVVLHHFSGTGTNDGRFPNGGLAQGPAGYLYGTTDSGGIGGDEDFFAGFGVVYRLLTDGDGYSIVRRFEGDVNDGHRPKDVFVGSDGLLYGTSQNASYAKNVDGLFRMQTTGGAFQFVFTWVTDDNQTIRLNRIVESGDGNFYGSSAAGGASNAGQVFKLEPNGTHYQTLHEFSIVGGDGSSPSTLIMDGDGTLYGTTLGGGENDKGTIYKLEANGNYSLLHSFEPQSGVPLGVIAASDGFLYGSAYHSRDLFRLSKDGQDYTVIINLPESPAGQLVEGSDFLLYGVTEPGSVFRLNPDGTDFGIIHTITNITGEAVFPAGIVEASDGKLYGTATRGGSSNQGMVFKMNKDGGQYEVVYSFVAPTGTLVFPNPLCEASDGYLYGTTYRGGGDGEGIIYRINKTAGYEFVTAFRENRGNPIGKLAEGPGGWMYGVTQESGDFGGGILFRFKLGSTAAYVLYHFGADGQGADPAAGVVTGSAGEIYGTTQYGGFGGGFGTVFRVDMNPVLSILRAGANAQVSWPLDGERYELQTTTNLASPWQFFSTGITNFPERVSATAPLGTGAHFYRLQKSP